MKKTKNGESRAETMSIYVPPALKKKILKEANARSTDKRVSLNEVIVGALNVYFEGPRNPGGEDSSVKKGTTKQDGKRRGPPPRDASKPW